MISTNPKDAAENRQRYQDTPFETIPHIDLGRAVKHLSTELQEVLRECGNDGIRIGWMHENRFGMLGHVSAGAAEDSIENNEAEMLFEAQPVIVWTAGYDANSEPIETVHLLTNAEANTIEQNATSVLLEELLDYYRDPGHASKVTANSPLDRLLRKLRRDKATGLFPCHIVGFSGLGPPHGQSVLHRNDGRKQLSGREP